MATDLIGPAMQGVLACVEESLTNSVGLSSIIPGGEVAWDNCDCDGQLWVRLINVTPRGQQPNCAPLTWDVTLGVGVVRCVTAMLENGNPPGAALMTADALKTTVDAHDIYEGLVCCTVPNFQLPATIGQWSPVGALGGCAGGEWQITAKLGTCECP